MMDTFQPDPTSPMSPAEMARRIGANTSRLIMHETRLDALEGDVPDPPDPPDPPAGELPFVIAPPQHPVQTTIQAHTAFDLLGDQHMTDHVWSLCTFPGGSRKQNGFSLRAYNGAPTLKRAQWNNCVFSCEDGYSLWCNGRIEDAAFTMSTFRSSTKESGVRCYNLNRVLFDTCDFINCVPNSRKWLLRFIACDFIMLRNCLIGSDDVWGGGITFNQGANPNGWFGKAWLENCVIYHDSPYNRALNVYPTAQMPSQGDGRIHLKNVEIHSTKPAPFGDHHRDWFTLKNVTHNGVLLPDG